jgi:hypothetical protein
VGDPPASWLSLAMAFTSVVEPTHANPDFAIRTRPARQLLLLAGGSAAAEDFCTPQGMPLAKHFE